MAEFILGFKALADLIPDIVGEPIENEHHDALNGDSLQQTTMGLMVWRKADNWTAFTDGYWTWIDGPNGLEMRANTERLPWEKTSRTVIPKIAYPRLPVAPWNLLTRRKKSDIKLLVVHWDGGPSIDPKYNPLSYYQWEARYHIAKDWGSGSHGYGLMYHECIDRMGRVWITRPETHVVWAQNLANHFGYAIKLDACQGSPPTELQFTSLEARLDSLRERFNLKRSDVFGHGELTQYGNQTVCPGPNLTRFVRAYRIEA